MLFMLVSRAKPGVKREELVERFSRQLHPQTWDLIRHGALSHILYKLGDEPGFFAVLHDPASRTPGLCWKALRQGWTHLTSRFIRSASSLTSIEAGSRKSALAEVSAVSP